MPKPPVAFLWETLDGLDGRAGEAILGDGTANHPDHVKWVKRHAG